MARRPEEAWTIGIGISVAGTHGVHGVEVVVDDLELDLVDLLLPLRVHHVSLSCGGYRLNGKYL